MDEICNSFSLKHLLLLSAAFIALLSSIWTFSRREVFSSVFLLTVSGIAFYSFVALLDPFLHIWDERFHALVAKNLLKHPLLPTLYDNPVVDMAYDRWDRSIVWLHKQPLFLWQIMISYKFWGINEFALRFPSVLMASFMLPLSFRVGKLLVDEMTGYVAAVLSLSSFYMVQVVSGVQATDHNDVAFLFYVSASIWAWVEYEYSSSPLKWRWVLLIGVFSGGAILCKWLVGLLVYAAFGLQLLMSFSKVRLFHLVTAFSITALIAVPWQLLSFAWYPAEAALEFEYNALHFTDVIEGHTEELWFHFRKIPLLFGNGANWLMIPGMLFLIYRSDKRRVTIAFVLLIIIIYPFYSLAVTKMQSYPFVVALPVYVCLAAFLGMILNLIKHSAQGCGKAIVAILIIGLMFYQLEPKKILQEHTDLYGANEYHNGLANNRLFFLQLEDELPENSVLFNVSGRHYVEAMFYTGFPSYEMVPSTTELDQVENASMKSIILDDGRVEIPLEIREDYRVEIIQYRIHSYH
jgi:4-amino-4-deoxy-L-arabinose transferase